MRGLAFGLGLTAACAAASAQEAPPAEAKKAEEPPPAAPTLFAGAPEDLAAKHPNVTVREIGRSRGGRPLVLVTVLPLQDGAPAKAAEVEWEALLVAGLSGARDRDETRLALDVAARLAARAADLPPRTAFLVLADANPDATAYAQGVRTRPGNDQPVDEDQDGDVDEDGPDDLDGDGEILEMRIEDPGGDFKPDPLEPRAMVRCQPGERGRWRLVGTEGRDDDGDGAFNEDGFGGYDPNRDWPSDWRTPHEQQGAFGYPVSLPETAAVVDFLVAHPNVAGFQSFHNAGGMILRGPGSKEFGTYPEPDDRVMRAIAARGEEQLPHYRSMVIWRDLYQVHGGEVNFAYEMLGIFGFSNELWTSAQYRGRKPSDKEDDRERLRFDDDLELGARHVDWKPFDHPQLGRVELGGWRRETGRVPPPFLLEELCHRNMAFVLWHASQMPLVRSGGAEARPLEGGLFEVTATFRNEGAIPTRAARAVEKRIGAPDRATLAPAPGGEVVVVAGGLADPATGRVPEPELRRPADLRLPRGIAGDGAVRVRWVVRGRGRVVASYRAEKGGTASVEVELE